MQIKIKPKLRQKARFLALQAIYQWQLTAEDQVNIRRQFFDKLTKKVDHDYFNDLVVGIIENVTAIDEIITPLLDRKFKDLDKVELAVLRLAVYELKYRSDVPYKVVINEALELTKNFGSIDGYKYINGVLDKAAAILR